MGRINFLWIIEDRISSCRESGVNMGLNLDKYGYRRGGGWGDNILVFFLVQNHEYRFIWMFGWNLKEHDSSL